MTIPPVSSKLRPLTALERMGVRMKDEIKPLSDHAAVKSQEQQVREQAQKWVGQTFFGTLLKQMENSPFKSDLFEGGRGGQAFSSIYHEKLANKMARGAGSKLVNAMTKSIDRKFHLKKEAA